jgi:hypothetical protein
MAKLLLNRDAKKPGSIAVGKHLAAAKLIIRNDCHPQASSTNKQL